MNRELDEKLVKEFPNLYRNRFADLRQTAMCWGFECGDGWYQLLYELSSKLEAMIVKLKEEYPNMEYPPCASQVKEKYGTLRFYMTSETDEMSKAIDEAEAKSAVTCENCGEPGVLLYHGWCEVRCVECADKRRMMHEIIELNKSLREPDEESTEENS